MGFGFEGGAGRRVRKKTPSVSALCTDPKYELSRMPVGKTLYTATRTSPPEDTFGDYCVLFGAYRTLALRNVEMPGDPLPPGHSYEAFQATRTFRCRVFKKPRLYKASGEGLWKWEKDGAALCAQWREGKFPPEYDGFYFSCGAVLFRPHDFVQVVAFLDPRSGRLEPAAEHR